MTSLDILRHRLINQQIAGTKFKKPQELVSWMGAMQAQDFAMAKWAIGLRISGLNDVDVERVFNKGTILRTHFLRPTWHFVTPADIRWILALTAPRVNAANAYIYRQCELDHKIFKRSNAILAKTLQGGKQLTRTELKSVLARARIIADGIRLVCLLMHAELDGIICSGARVGKQFTYALLEERAPQSKLLNHDEALAELTQRYFVSRGPATVQDFAWWSGLTIKQARDGLATLPSHFAHEMINGHKYFFPAIEIKNNSLKVGQATFLLPDYDEYGISYRNRNALFNSKNIVGEKRGGNTIYNHMVVIDGMIAGTWRREIKNKRVAIETTLFSPLSKAKDQLLKNAVRRYVEFIGNKDKS